MKPATKIRRGLGEWLTRISPSCREVAHLQSLSFGHDLPPRKRFGVRVHLLLCRWCRRYERQLDALAGLIGQEDPAANPPSKTLSAETRERLKASLRETKRPEL
jgi:hypothetical protein